MSPLGSRRHLLYKDLNTYMWETEAPWFVLPWLLQNFPTGNEMFLLSLQLLHQKISLHVTKAIQVLQCPHSRWGTYRSLVLWDGRLSTGNGVGKGHSQGTMGQLQRSWQLGIIIRGQFGTQSSPQGSLVLTMEDWFFSSFPLEGSYVLTPSICSPSPALFWYSFEENTLCKAPPLFFLMFLPAATLRLCLGFSVGWGGGGKMALW